MSDYSVWDGSREEWVPITWDEYVKLNPNVSCSHGGRVQVWTASSPSEYVADICMLCDEQLTRSEWIRRE